MDVGVCPSTPTSTGSSSSWTSTPIQAVDSLELAKQQLLPERTTVHNPYRPLCSVCTSSSSPPVSIPDPPTVISPVCCPPSVVTPPQTVYWNQTHNPATTTNYIQRGNISGNWATYFSGPNYLTVDSMMSQAPTPPPMTTTTTLVHHHRQGLPPATILPRHPQPPPPLVHRYRYPPGPGL